MRKVIHFSINVFSIIFLHFESEELKMGRLTNSNTNDYGAHLNSPDPISNTFVVKRESEGVQTAM